MSDVSKAEPRDSPEVGDILVVDDHPSNITAIQVALNGYSDRLITASSGEEALRLLLQRDVALILLDVQLPNMDGFQVARLIRERERSRDTPIIFVTAFNQSDRDILTGYSLGAVDFLFKPIVAEVLRAKVSVLLALQERTAEVRRQAHQLRDHERREHERVLEEERRRWHEEALRRQMEEERRRADELARTVSELERAEAELTRINRELEEVDRRKDEFLAVLAHELRNPLAPLAAGLDLIREVETSDAPREAVQAREAMERQLSHLTRLVDDLLDVSRINSGKIELQKTAVELSEIVSQATQTSQPLLKQFRHRLEVTLPDEPLCVLGDAVRLTQVVSNLLNNAARYTPAGGEIRLNGSLDGEEVRLTVSDNGRGISPELLDSVFDMFTRERQDGGGLGVGLALVERLVRMHEGRVRATSAGPDQGSQFDVWLPRHAGKPVLERESLAPHGYEGLSVAIVEDNDDIRELVCAALTRRGLTVRAAADGETGVALILEMRPDVAVVDMGLPKLDGCEVARRVREVLGPDALHLIAMTGYGQATDRERAKDAGFDHHLVKPVQPKHLLQVIATTARR